MQIEKKEECLSLKCEKSIYSKKKNTFEIFNQQSRANLVLATRRCKRKCRNRKMWFGQFAAHGVKKKDARLLAAADPRPEGYTLEQRTLSTSVLSDAHKKRPSG